MQDVDDMLLDATSLSHLTEVTGLLSEDLKSIDLHLDPSKSRNLSIDTMELTHEVTSIAMGEDYDDLLFPKQCHRHLGRYRSVSRGDRLDIELVVGNSQT